MEQIHDVEEKEVRLSEVQRSKIYELARRVSHEMLDEVCPALFRAIMTTDSKLLKNQLGIVIFHLQKNDRINTVIGLQKLLEASLKVAPEELFKILGSADSDAQELAQKIKALL
ncbi:hypothetical protein LCGC14_0746770 [marine sediment metagenome]|uniref:Uncharacterized protein n=1 Tax=marine sediment metagenome TaxID=412755 RepID=A0A0F9Q560_9ZZZZ